MLFPSNTPAALSIDEMVLSTGELYTIVTNKEAKECQGSLVVIIKGTQSKDIIAAPLNRLPERLRHQVKEVTLDLAGQHASGC